MKTKLIKDLETLNSELNLISNIREEDGEMITFKRSFVIEAMLDVLNNVDVDKAYRRWEHLRLRQSEGKLSLSELREFVRLTKYVK